MGKNTFRAFKPLIPYFRRYRLRYIAGFLCLMAVDLAQMLIPQFMRQAIDLIAGGAFTMTRIIPIARNMILVMAAISIGRFIWRFCIHGASRKIEAELREKLFAHLLTLSYDFYQKNKIGDILSRASSDLNAVRESVGMGLVALVDGTVMAASILVIIFIQDPRTASLAIIPLPLITLIILFFGGAMGTRFKRAQEAYAAMSDTAQETFAGIRVVKSFVKEWWFIKKFADTNEDYRNANMELVKLYGVFYPFISFLSGITALLVLLVGGSRVVMGRISPGDMVALFRYFQMLIWPLIGAGFVVNMIQRGAVSLGRVNEIMDTVPSIASPRVPESAYSDDAPVIAVTGLTFRYPEGRTALEDVSLTIAAGSFVGITGRTGAGKSTLIKTFTRTVDPPANTVRIKGVWVENWDLGELRARFGVTPQDSYLFSDSIKRNIRYGLERGGEEGDEAVPWDLGAMSAPALAALDRDMESFALGWDTMIGERGLTLSGGQKQRVAIARALAVEPEILILDDSLSAVDRETERQVLTGLLHARKGRTTIIISHRVSTLKDADYVVVLDKGRVAEQGSPAELMARGGFFSRMAAIQDPPVSEKDSFIDIKDTTIL